MVTFPVTKGLRNGLVAASALLQEGLREFGAGEIVLSRGAAFRHLASKHGVGRYLPEYNSLLTEPLTTQDSDLKHFIKAEKWVVWEDTTKAPRNILYRRERYTIELAKFLVPFERKAYLFFQGQHAWLHTSKGMSPHRRAQYLSRLWARIGSAAALCLDFSGFDGTVSEELLEVEHRYYELAFRDRYLSWLLRQQRVMKGKGRWGTRFSRIGGRASGDYNTALGNTLINLSVQHYVVELFRERFPEFEAQVCVEGDDGVIIMSSEWLSRFEGHAVTVAAGLGLKMVATQAHCLEQLEYCSSRVLEIDPGVYTSVRTIPKAFSSDLWSVSPVIGRGIDLVARSQAVSAALSYAGIPVYQSFGQWMLSHTASQREALTTKDERRRRERVLEHVADQLGAHECLTGSLPTRIADLRAGLSPPVSTTARASFALMTGLLPSHQLQIEADFDSRRGRGPLDH